MLRKLLVFGFLLVPIVAFGQNLPRYEIALSKIELESAISFDSSEIKWRLDPSNIKDPTLYEFEANDLIFDKESGLLSIQATAFCVTTPLGIKDSRGLDLTYSKCFPIPSFPIDFKIDLSQIFEGWQTIEIRERFWDDDYLTMKRTFYKKILDYDRYVYKWQEVIGVNIEAEKK